MFFYSLDKPVELLPSFAFVFCFGADGRWLHYYYQQFEDGPRSAEALQSFLCCRALAAAEALHFRSPERDCSGSTPPAAQCNRRTLYSFFRRGNHIMVLIVQSSFRHILFLLALTTN